MVTSYQLNDGLQSFEFNAGAYFRSSRTGEFFFGGINGFNAFYPEQVLANPRVPPVVFTTFKIFDQPVVGDTAITYRKKIKLRYNQNFFSFEFAALDFSNPDKNQYAYKLDGFDQDWIYCGTRRYVSYTNLPPRKYTLRVKASNNDHVWNEQGISLDIEIIPPFWQRLWFRVLLLILIPGAFFSIHQWRVHDLEMQRRHLENEVEKRTFELRQKSDELERKEKLYRNLVETSPDAILLLDLDGNILMGNRRAVQLAGFDLNDPNFGQNAMNYVHPSEHNRAKTMFKQLMYKKHIRNYELQLVRSDQTSFPADISASVIMDGVSKPRAFIVVFRDVTDRKLVEERINTSLKEKDVLLKEIHHRVKNNLQLVSSLLNLQSAGIKDPVTLSKFKDSQNRVRSMALIHEKLYQTEDLSNIDFDSYIRNLVNSLFRSYGINSSRLELNIEVEQVRLGVDIAIPCGLIINELVSNALKHAFPPEHLLAVDGDGMLTEKPSLTIYFRTFPPDLIDIVISDNGVGMPADFDITKSKSLGLQLVNTLIEQLNGTIDFQTNHGTTITIQFTR